MVGAPRLMREAYGGKLFKDGIAVRTTIEPTGKPPVSFYTPIDKTSLEIRFQCKADVARIELIVRSRHSLPVPDGRG